MKYVQPIGAAVNAPYIDANPGLAIEGSPVPAAAIEHPMREIEAVITGAGLVPATGDLTQLRQAIAKMIQSGQRAVIINNAVFAGAVTGTGKAVYWDSGNSRFDLALADGSVKQSCIGFADVANANVYAFGDAVLFAGLTPGARYYLDGATAGAITTAAPTNAVFVGIARNATEIFIDVDAASGSAQQAGEICFFARSAAPTGFLKANGAAVSRTAYAALFAALCPTLGAATISNGAGAVVTFNSHGRALNDPVTFTTTGALPTGLVAGTTYYAAGTISANTFQLSASIGGALITTSSAGSGAHTLISAPFGTPSADTANFLLPDLRGEFLRGYDDARGVDAARVLGSAQAQDLQPHTHTQVIQNGAGATFGNVPAITTSNAIMVSSQPTGSSGIVETRPRNVAFLACIKY